MKVPSTQLSPYMGHTGPVQTGAKRGHRGARENVGVKARDGPEKILNDRVISLPEASAISGLSLDTLKRCNRRGELKIIKLSPRRVGVRLSTLWEFIDGRAA
jgi:hypothetical protein